MKRYTIKRYTIWGNNAMDVRPNDSIDLNRCVRFIKSMRLPYIVDVWTGTYTQSDSVGIKFHRLVENTEIAELERILSDWIDDQNLRLLKYRKKLTTFLPSHSWSK